MSDCKKCINRREINTPKVFSIGNATFNVNGNSVQCKLDKVEEITIADGEMECSDYVEEV